MPSWYIKIGNHDIAACHPLVHELCGILRKQFAFNSFDSFNVLRSGLAGHEYTAFDKGLVQAILRW